MQSKTGAGRAIVLLQHAGRWMRAIVEAIGVVVGGKVPSTPISLGVGRGEIVGLLFPPDRPRAPVLRTLAGLDAPAAGKVRVAGRRRILLAKPGRQLADALSSRPDLVLLDAANDVDRSTWARLASERATGTSFVVATASVAQASRSDRMSLASWNDAELARAIQQLARQMTSQVQEFLALLGEARHRGTGSRAADLRRLNVGARILLAEMRLRTRAAGDEPAFTGAAAEITGASLSDRLLDAVIAEDQKR
jgi:hypothetical protein